MNHDNQGMPMAESRPEEKLSAATLGYKQLHTGSNDELEKEDRHVEGSLSCK
jgi:hypothetical protein